VQYNTVLIRKPFGRTLGLTIVFVVLLFGVLEVALRVGYDETHLGQIVPSLGSSHHQMEMQLARLEWFTDQEGPVDCIFLGSSLVWLGFDPAVFEDAFMRETGQEIKCFNLGIETLPTSAAAALADYVIQQYHPWLLIYGTSARDYAIHAQADDTKAILETPWLRQNLGYSSFDGFLYTHSFAIRYLKHVKSLVQLDADSLRAAYVAKDDLSGFLPKTRPALDEHFQAGAIDAAKWIEHYEIQEENLLGLVEMINGYGNDVQVLVVEMPLSQDYYEYFANGKIDYERFVNQIDTLLQSQNNYLVKTSHRNLIPVEGWWDRSHMNAIGARVFSTWLGEQIGLAFKDGELQSGLLEKTVKP
jgi:hypothetical protein